MNLRILKKLSKRAVPLLAYFDVTGEAFIAKKDESYTGLIVNARKHWERGRSVHADCLDELEIKKPAADGRGWIYMHPPSHPRKGTPMVGETRGYEEPEWEERTALEELINCILYQDRPASMSDAEWAMAMRITGVTPFNYDGMDDWDECQECGAGACTCGGDF